MERRSHCFPFVIIFCERRTYCRAACLGEKLGPSLNSARGTETLNNLCHEKEEGYHGACEGDQRIDVLVRLQMCQRLAHEIGTVREDSCTLFEIG